MLQFVLAAFVALNAQVPEPPTDRQVLARLPETDAVRTNLSITKSPVMTVDGIVWACGVYYTEVVNGEPRRRVHVVDLGTVRGDKWNTPAIPKPNPYRR
jgi:hypothetical protein